MMDSTRTLTFFKEIDDINEEEVFIMKSVKNFDGGMLQNGMGLDVFHH